MDEPAVFDAAPAGDAPAEAGPFEAGPVDPVRAGSASVDDGLPPPLGIGVQVTGHGGVDDLLQRLGDVDQVAVAGHLEVYEDVHRGLRDTLTALDQRPGPPAPGAAVPARPSGS